MMELVKREIDSLADSNKDSVYAQFNTLSSAYKKALTTEPAKDEK